LLSLKYTDNQGEEAHSIISLPEGAYEIEQIITEICKQAKEKADITDLEIIPDYATQKIKIRCPSATIKFLGSYKILDDGIVSTNSLGKLLGFSMVDTPIEASADWLESDIPVTISSINEICVECSLVSGSYRNGQKCHTLYSFYPDVPPGYKICERPGQLVYLPIACQEEISNITLRLTDQLGNLLDFRGEEISIQLDLKTFF
jgi:hypothetical protein